jgi:hypothetical protein
MLAGVVLAATAVTVRAEEDPKPAPGATAPADCCAPTFRTVCVNEWRPETYTTTRTVYDRVCTPEKYTAYRCETVLEDRPYTCTVYEKKFEEQEVVRHVCVKVPVEEERTVCQTHVVCKPETRVVRKCVDKGHYECKEVECGPSWSDRLRKLCSRHKDCCEPCCEPCPRTKTVKVWVPCPTWEEHTVTCMKRVCETVQTKVKVIVCKTEIKEEKVKVQVCKLVPKTETKTCKVCVTKRVAYEATRNVVKCVPRTETVTCTKMVCHKVMKQVPCEAACCETSCHKHHFSLSGLSFRHHHESCCD